MLVQHGLEQNAVERPTKTALVCGGCRIAYAELDHMADRLANALLDRGLRRGDRVAIYLGNTVEAVVGIFATLKAGGTFVVVNRSTKLDKLSYILGNCQAAALITEARVAAQGATAALRARVAGLRCVILTGAGANELAGNPWTLAFDAIQAALPAVRPAIAAIDLDLACLLYTSGSTGEPRGVMCDHAGMVFVSNSVMQYLENTESDVLLNILPLSFGYGLYQVLMATMFGGTAVLEPGFAFPAQTLQQIEAERVTGFAGTPTVVATLLQLDLGQFDLSSLRYLTNAAAALPPSHIRQLRDRLPGTLLYSMYGQTETKRTLYLPPGQLDRRPASVGIAIPGTEVWIEDEDGRRLGPHEVGELVVRGRHVMRGYWGDPAATDERFRPGPIPGERLCYTGDLFRRDEEGYFYFVARKDDIIKTRGEKVAPREVENVIHSLPGVIEAAVFGVPDAILGQAVKAVVVAEEGVSSQDVLAHCRAHLEDFMIPKLVEFRHDLPKTASGKVLKRALAAA